VTKDKKILGNVTYGQIPSVWSQVIPANPRRLTLTFAGQMNNYTIRFGQSADGSRTLSFSGTGQVTVTFTRETLGNLIGMSIWMQGASGEWSIVETWEG
jgi:hypothetical protein